MRRFNEKPKPPEPYINQLVSKLVENTWEPLSMLIGKSEIATLYEEKHKENLLKIKPEPFEITRPLVGHKADGNYTLHFSYTSAGQEPTLSQLSAESGKNKFNLQIDSLKDIPQQSAFLAARKHLPRQSREIGPDPSQQKKI